MSDYTFTKLEDDAKSTNLRIPEILYKYRDWEDNNNKRFITEREVYVAPPCSFTDEKDCKNPKRYDLLDKKQTILFGLKLSRTKNPNYTRQQHRNEARKFEKTGLLRDKKYIADYWKKEEADYNLRLGILSLTDSPCLEKMWNSYANNSTGFCIGYNSKVLFNLFHSGGAVIYEDELPIILPEPLMPFYEANFKRLYFKEKIWNYEKEYRADLFSETPLTISDRQIKTPFEAYNRIILGQNITEKSRFEITKAVRDSIGAVPIFEYEEFRAKHYSEK